MRILLCPDSFKGTLTSYEAAMAMQQGILKADPDAETVILTVGDGGEGSLDSVCRSLESSHSVKYLKVRTLDPLQREIEAAYAIIDEKAGFIETAAASGLTLLTENERDIMLADTYGTGLLIADAYRRGVRHFFICLGGSATCDGGSGAYSALKELHIHSGFDSEGTLLPDAEFTLLCDVKNPFCGDNGAARIFAPQKGANPEQVELLELRNRSLAEEYRKIKGIDIENMSSAGAAGGLAGMFMACCNSSAVNGIEKILDIVDFDKAAKECQLIITGEGRLDSTTLAGKAPLGILMRGKKLGIPVAAVGGRIDNEKQLYAAGFRIVKQATPDNADKLPDKEEASKFLENAAYELIKDYYKNLNNGKDTQFYN